MKEDLEALAQRYLEEKSSGWAEETGENQARALELFVRFLASERRTLGQDDVLAFVRHVRGRTTRKGEPWSPRSVEWALLAARSFLRWAHLRGHLLEDLSRLIAIRSHQRLPRALSEPEVLRLIEAGPQGRWAVRDRALLELLYGTGLRASEAARLTLEELSLSEGVLLVKEGKGRKDRLVPFGERVREAILRYLREERPSRTGPLFLSAREKPLTRGGVQQVVARSARRAGLVRPISPHRLRHSYATHLLRHGAPLPAIQALLGHASLVSTEVYLALRVEDLARMIKRSHPREQPTERVE